MKLLGTYLLPLYLVQVMSQKTYWWMGTNAFGGDKIIDAEQEKQNNPGLFEEFDDADEVENIVTGIINIKWNYLITYGNI